MCIETIYYYYGSLWSTMAVCVWTTPFLFDPATTHGQAVFERIPVELNATVGIFRGSQWAVSDDTFTHVSMKMIIMMMLPKKKTLLSSSPQVDNRLAFFVSMILLFGSSLATVTSFVISPSQPAFCGSTRHSPSSRSSSSGDRSDLSTTSQSSVPISIALTREEGKNDKLRAALEASSALLQSIHPIQIYELPCIAHADGSDYDQLASTLQSTPWNYVAVTSPEAARVLISAWTEAIRAAPPPVCAVGKATMEVLEQHDIPVAFCPSKATATTLVTELPGQAGDTVLYPASQRAKQTLEEGLRQRGFHVTRLNTYDTVTAEWQEMDTARAAQCQIACFASPSAIKGWLQNTNNDEKNQPRTIKAACIGETSAQACRELGWSEENIFYPDQPGIEGWVDAN